MKELLIFTGPVKNETNVIPPLKTRKMEHKISEFFLIPNIFILELFIVILRRNLLRNQNQSHCMLNFLRSFANSA